MKISSTNSLFIAFLVICSSCGAIREDSYCQLSSESSIEITNNYLFELLYADDSVLIASSFNAQANLISLNVKSENDSDAVGLLKKGRGPKEIMNAAYKVSNDTIHVISGGPHSLDKVLKIPLSDIQDQAHWKLYDCQDMKGFHMGNSFDIAEDNKYITVGGYLKRKSFLSILDYSQSNSKEIDFWPNDGFKGAEETKQMIYRSGAHIFSNGKKLLYTCGEGYYAILLDLFSGQQSAILNKHPKYQSSSDGINPTRNASSDPGIISFATKNLIYLAPLNCKIIDGEYSPNHYKGYPPFFFDTIYVYNWDGILQSTYQLDTPCCAFIADSNDRVLYSLTGDPDYKQQIIKKYNL